MHGLAEALERREGGMRPGEGEQSEWDERRVMYGRRFIL